MKTLFVVGVGRSGTSLIQSMLSSHPEMSFLPETSLLRRIVLPGKLDSEVHSKGIDAAASVLMQDSRTVRISQDLRTVLKAAGHTGGAGVGLRFFQLLMEGQARGDNASVVGEKDPRLVEYLPALHAAWPAAYVLHIVRDPRDVLASRKRAGWSRGRATWTEVLAYRTQLRAGRHDGKHFGRRYIEIRYEELLKRPEIVLGEVCAQVGLTYDPVMLDFAEAARNLVAADETGWHQNTLRPLLRGNTGKWRSRLSPLEATLVERTCGQGFEGNGHDDMYLDRWAGTRNASPRVRVLGEAMAILVRIAEAAYSGVRFFRAATAARRARRASL